MRPGQNKRMRGRNNNNNRKGPNPLTRSYESNGPDVKIRGTAHHIGEKYLQLARDAHSSGDPVRAESYLQHAEHYFRVIAAAQQTQHGYGRHIGDQADLDDDDDGDDGSMPDRFASPAERPIQQPFPDRQGFQGQQGYQGGGERRDGQGYAQGERSYDNRNGRSYDNRGNQDRGHQGQGYAQPGQGHTAQGSGQGYGSQGHGSQANGNQGFAGQNHTGHGQGGQGQMNQGQVNHGQVNHGQASYGQANHGHAGQAGGGQSGNGHERGAGQRGDGERQPQHERVARDQSRDYDNRQRPPRPPRPAVEARQPEEAMNGLPAFITAPTRISAEQGAHQSEASEQAAAYGEAEESVHLRPRRRRRSKAEFADRGSPAAEGGEAGREPLAAPAAEPVED